MFHDINPLTVLLEATITIVFRAEYHEMKPLIQWDLTSTEWDGLCSHNPLIEGTRGAENEEATLLAFFKEMGHDSDMLLDGAEDKTSTTEPVETALAAAIDDIRLSYKKVTMSSAMAMKVGKRMIFGRTTVKNAFLVGSCAHYRKGGRENRGPT